MTASQISSLRKFCADPELAQLKGILAEFDAFALLGVSGSEETHSDILAWLLNPRENHSASSFFLTEFLLETKAATDEQVRDIDRSETSVQREWRNVVGGETGFLDILILNTGARFACAIENKIRSGEHGEQLTRYRQALEQEHGNFHRSYLFVSPPGTAPERPEERCFWTSVGYGTILQLVEKTLKDGMNPDNEEVRAFLRQYVTTLRRRIVPNTNMEWLATKIYLQHREAIDLINRQKDGYIDDLGDICKEAIGLQKSWCLVSERNGGKLIGFIDTSWKAFCIFNTGTGFLPETDSLLMLDFDLREIGQLNLILTIASADKEDVRKLLFDKTQGKCPGIFDHRGSPRGGYRNSYIRLYASKPILSEADFIDGDRASWRDSVEEWVSDFAKNVFPEMNEIIVKSFKEIEDGVRHQQASGDKM